MHLNEYETVCIFKPYSAADGVDKVVQKIEPYVKEGGGTLLHTQTWGRKRLAYLVEKEREGLYVCFHYAAVSTQIAEIEKILSYDESVLKYLTIRRHERIADLEALKKAPAPEIPPVFRQDSDRPDYRSDYRSDYRADSRADRSDYRSDSRADRPDSRSDARA